MNLHDAYEMAEEYLGYHHLDEWPLLTWKRGR